MQSKLCLNDMQAAVPGGEIVMNIHSKAVIFAAIVVLGGCDLSAQPNTPAASSGNGFDAAAGNAASRTTDPCQHQDRFREFDFWVGEWEVHDADGQLAGKNVIEAAHKGCVLVEKWQSATGGTGMSMNYLDQASGDWVQVWIDSGGGQIDIRGGLTGEGMLLTGQIHYTANGTTLPFRGLWTPLSDGRVRQFFQQSDDNGETWQTWFEGFYSRVER